MASLDLSMCTSHPRGRPRASGPSSALAAIRVYTGPRTGGTLFDGHQSRKIYRKFMLDVRGGLSYADSNKAASHHKEAAASTKTGSRAHNKHHSDRKLAHLAMRF